VLVDATKTHIISFGANRFPNGVKSLSERLTNEHKRDYLEHAERGRQTSFLVHDIASFGWVVNPTSKLPVILINSSIYLYRIHSNQGINN
jgi:hypothetical protein